MLRLTKSFRLPRLGGRPQSRRTARRKGDSEEHSAEATVLKALHVMAKQSSPHKASARAGFARAITVIETSMVGLSDIKVLVDECQSLCIAGIETNARGKRDLLATRYAEIVEELNAVAQGTGHAGCHLIGDASCILEVDLGEPGQFKLKLPHINLTSGTRGLALPKPNRTFESKESLEQFARHLNLVQERLEKTEMIFRDHAADLSKRLAMILEGAYVEDDRTPKGRISPTPFQFA